MSCKNVKKIFNGDIGVVLRVYAGIDISTATSILFKVRNPNGTDSTWTASLADDNNYYATYTTVSGDLDVSGTWLLYILVTFADSTSFAGETTEFEVFDNFT